MVVNLLNRRKFIGSVAGLGAGVFFPGGAAIALPSIEEIVGDAAIPALGNPLGGVTIVEFVDYQCPYCKICYREIAKLVAEDSDVRVVMKDWPIFGGISVYAARAMVAASSDQNYSTAVAGLMDNNRYLSRGRVDRILANAGIERTAVSARMTQQAQIDELLNRNIETANALGLTGTPGLLVGQILYRHGLGIEKLRTAVAFVRSGEGTYPT